MLNEYETRSFALTRRQAQALRDAPASRLRIGLGADDGIYEVTADSYVGAVVTPEVSVLIRPKVPLHNLFHLLGVAPPDFGEDRFRFATDRDLLVIMASVFAYEVDRATMRGVLRGYLHTEERLLSPRGRIDLVEQIRRPGMVSPIACRFDEYTSDVPPNRALVAAIDRLLRVPGLPPQLRTALGRLLQRFAEVRHEQVDPAAVERWTPTRLDQHYAVPMCLAAIVLRNLTLAHQAGTTMSSTFLVDMNELYQTFVAAGLRRNLVRQLDVFEEPKVPLAASGRLPMRPDLVVRRGSSSAYVGDAKYKLSTGPGRMADYYQLLAYTTAMDLREGVLIYAQDPGDSDDPLPSDGGRWPVHTVRIRNTSTDIHVYRLRLDGTNDQLDQAVADLATWLLGRIRPAAEEAA